MGNYELNMSPDDGKKLIPKFINFVNSTNWSDGVVKNIIWQVRGVDIFDTADIPQINFITTKNDPAGVRFRDFIMHVENSVDETTSFKVFNVLINLKNLDRVAGKIRRFFREEGIEIIPVETPPAQIGTQGNTSEAFDQLLPSGEFAETRPSIFRVIQQRLNFKYVISGFAITVLLSVVILILVTWKDEGPEGAHKIIEGMQSTPPPNQTKTSVYTTTENLSPKLHPADPATFCEIFL